MKLIIFDLDGTLINSIEDLGTAVNFALEQMQYPQHDIDEYYMMVGHGVRNLVRKAMPEELQADEALLDRLLDLFVSYYSDHIAVHTRPYPGIPELLERLSSAGYALAVASNKFQSGAETLVKRFFPDIPFVEILGNRPGAPLKPSPEIVFSSMSKAGISLSEAWDNVTMAGDSPTDIKTAENAGIRPIAVSWGFRPAESLAAAAYVASTPEELEEMIVKVISRP